MIKSHFQQISIYCFNQSVSEWEQMCVCVHRYACAWLHVCVCARVHMFYFQCQSRYTYISSSNELLVTVHKTHITNNIGICDPMISAFVQHLCLKQICSKLTSLLNIFTYLERQLGHCIFKQQAHQSFGIEDEFISVRLLVSEKQESMQKVVCESLFA